MGKRRATGVCAYCGNGREVEEEHVIPRSWSSADALSAAKLKVPACAKCNRDFSRREQQLQRFAGLSTWIDDEVMGRVAA